MQHPPKPRWTTSWPGLWTASFTLPGRLTRGFLSGRLGLPVKIARDPQACIAVGTGMALENLQVIRRGQHYMT